MTPELENIQWEDTSPPNLMVISDLITGFEQALKDKGISFPDGYEGANAIFEKMMFEELPIDTLLPLYQANAELISDPKEMDSGDFAELIQPILKIIQNQNQGEEPTEESDGLNHINIQDQNERNDFQSFARESLEQVEEMSNKLPHLRMKKGDASFLNILFRRIHTVKGAAGFFGLDHLTHIAHELENVLDKARVGKLEIDDEVINLLIKGSAWLKSHLSKVQKQLDSQVPPFSFTMSKEHSDPIHYGCLAVLSRPDINVEIDSNLTEEENQSDTTIQISQDYLDQFIGDVGDLLNLAHIFKHSESVLSKSNMNRNEIQRFKENFFALEDKTEGLQGKLMKLRKVKIKAFLDKVPKILFRLSQVVGKKVQVNITGEEIEIDRSMLKVLEDPFVHILRNSMDHGIETPEERSESGKDSTGSFNIDVILKQNMVHITIADDGKGINPDMVSKKALEKGIIAEEKLEQFTEQQKQELIFMPGFSTRDQASEISGRGVGMDVVKSKILEAGGQVALKSTVGEGTQLELSLPVAATLATRSILRIQCHNKWYGVPMEKIEYLSSLSKENTILPKSGNMELFPYRGKNIPIISLNKVFSYPTEHELNYRSLIVIQNNTEYIAVEVDDFQEFEIHVMQSFLEGHLDRTPFEGASVLGDGSICLLLSFKKVLELSHLEQNETNTQSIISDTLENINKSVVNTLILQPSSESFKVSIDMKGINRIENFKIKMLSRLKGQRIYRTSNGLLQFYELADLGIGHTHTNVEDIESLLIISTQDTQIAIGIHKIIDMHTGDINFLGPLGLPGIKDSWSYHDQLIAVIDQETFNLTKEVKSLASSQTKLLAAT